MSVGLNEKQIGRALQQARKAAGFKSARAFADYLHIPVSRYTAYEQGRRAFTYEQAWEFADALDCTMDELGGRVFAVPQESISQDPKFVDIETCYKAMDDTGRAVMHDMAASLSAHVERAPVQEHKAV